MRSVRLAVAFAMVAALGTGAVARAAPAPKPVCRLVTDPANDPHVTVPGAGPVPYVDSAVDILSADVVSDAKGLGVTVRLGSVGGTSVSSTRTDLGLPEIDLKVFVTIESMQREMVFDATGYADNAAGYAFTAAGGKWLYTFGHIGNDASYTYADEHFLYYASARGALDSLKNEVRMSMSWTDLRKYGYVPAKRDRAVKVRVRARDWWVDSNSKGDALDPGDVRYEGSPRDDAATAAAYPLGAKTCTSRV